MAAAEVFAISGEVGEAAAERLAAAWRLRAAASFQAATGLLEVARPESQLAGRTDLTARIVAMEGNVRGRLGESDRAWRAYGRRSTW